MGGGFFFICGTVVERSPRRRVLVNYRNDPCVGLVNYKNDPGVELAEEGKGYHTGAGGRGNGKLRLVHVSLSDRGC